MSLVLSEPQLQEYVKSWFSRHKTVKFHRVVWAKLILAKQLYFLPSTPYMHAEVQVIKLISHFLKRKGLRHTLRSIQHQRIVLFRQLADGSLGCAQPCHFCCRAFHSCLPRKLLKQLTIVVTVAFALYHSAPLPFLHFEFGFLVWVT